MKWNLVKVATLVLSICSLNAHKKGNENELNKKDDQIVTTDLSWSDVDDTVVHAMYKPEIHSFIQLFNIKNRVNKIIWAVGQGPIWQGSYQHGDILAIISEVTKKKNFPTAIHWLSDKLRHEDYYITAHPEGRIGSALSTDGNTLIDLDAGVLAIAQRNYYGPNLRGLVTAIEIKGRKQPVFAPNSKHFALIENNTSKIELYDTKLNKPQVVDVGSENRVEEVSFSKDGKICALVSTFFDNDNKTKISYYDTATWKLITSIVVDGKIVAQEKFKRPITHANFYNEDKLFMVNLNQEKFLNSTSFDLRSNKPIFDIKHAYDTQKIFALSGTLLPALRSQQKLIECYDMLQGRAIQSFHVRDLDELPQHLCVNSDQTKILLAIKKSLFLYNIKKNTFEKCY